MDRRRILATLGAGSTGIFAGCTDPILAVINDCSHDLPEPEQLDGEDGFPTLTISTEVPYSADDYSIAVWMTEQYSSTTVAKLQIEAINERNRSREDNWGSTPPFSRYRGEHVEEEAALFVRPSSPSTGFAGINHVESVADEYESGEDLSEPVNGCWQINYVASNDLDRTVSFDPCETLSETYTVYAAASNDGCLPAGRYRFEDGPVEFEITVSQ